MVQIVDARNPLLFRCEDLEAYVREVGTEKDNLILVNKSDFLTEAQREEWAKYFRERDIKAVFFSALSSQELDIVNEEEEEERMHNENEELSEEDEEDEGEEAGDSDIEQCRQDLENLSTKPVAEGCSNSKPAAENSDGVTESTPEGATNSGFVTSSNLLSRTELMEVFRTMHTKKRVSEKAVTIGLVGYPNVGKSSTINCLMLEKKVSVSATPGKTKHFQVNIQL